MLQLNFDPFPRLETERLVLRKLEPSDAAVIFLLRTNEDVLRYLGKEPQKSVQEAVELIEQFNKSIEQNEYLMWGIAFRHEPSVLIGTICLWKFKPEHYRAEIGYMLHPAHWRKGVMKETILKVLDYGFNTIGLHSIEALLSPDNAGSVAVLESCGFAKEGHLKEDFYFRGVFGDTLIYSKLQSSGR